MKMELTLVKYDDPVLKKPTERFDFDRPQFDIKDFSLSLIEVMRKNGGVGLAAPQVGYPFSIFAFQYVTDMIAINPKIVEEGEETIDFEEGCLSFPGLFIRIKRPRLIRVRYSSPNGETATHSYANKTARIFQHEFDHLQGIIYQSRANYLHKEQAANRWKKILRQQKQKVSA